MFTKPTNKCMRVNCEEFWGDFSWLCFSNELFWSKFLKILNGIWKFMEISMNIFFGKFLEEKFLNTFNWNFPCILLAVSMKLPLLHEMLHPTNLSCFLVFPLKTFAFFGIFHRPMQIHHIIKCRYKILLCTHLNRLVAAEEIWGWLNFSS